MKQADAIWNNGPDLIDDEGEVRELTSEDFAQFSPFASLPADEREFLLQVKTATIQPDSTAGEEVTLKLSKPVLERFRATGEGWENKVDEALRQWLDEHKAS